MTYFQECRKVLGSEPSHSQGNSHFGRWSPGGLPKLQRAIWGGQNSMAYGVLYIIEKLLERRCLKWARIAHLDILKHKLWPKEGPRVKLPVWLPTRKSQKSTRFTWLQTTCHIPLESSRWELQLCFGSHFDPRSSRKVMGLQSRKSFGWRDFGTPTRKSRERKAIWMWALWRGPKYTTRGRWWLPPSLGRGESCVSVLPVARLSTKGAPTMH
jgi:hypothetical protein